jgi:hypothetical protein
MERKTGRKTLRLTGIKTGISAEYGIKIKLWRKNMHDPNVHPSKKTSHYIILGVLVVALLAVAAFVGGSLLRDSSKNSKKADFQIMAAEGLPQTPFELIGGVISQEGNSLFIQAIQMNEALKMTGGKGVDKKGGNSNTGPATEVVITHETEFYRDATWDPYLSGEASKSNLGNEIQQEIVPGSADEVGPGSSVTVWGERNGDRVVAKYILYTLPFPEDDRKITK